MLQNCYNCDKETNDARYCSKECWNVHKLPALIKMSGMNEGIYKNYNFQNAKFITEEEKRLEKKAKEYLSKEIDRGLFVYGSTGSGKTYIVFSIVKEIMKKLSIESKLFNVPRMIADYKDSNFDDRIITKAETVPIAVFDDLGSEYISEMSRELITRIIDQRLIYGRLTFITSNLNPEMIGKLIDARLISRIKALTYSIEIKDEDKRNSQ